MRFPVIRGVIDRRILVNFCVDPDVLAAQLPAPFRPKLHQGFALVGICLIRLKRVRPTWAPAWTGVSSENAAHRAAVAWDDADGVHEGVFIWRRDTDSRLNAFVGGRLFPGVHRRGQFTVNETAERFEIALQSDDGASDMTVHGRASTAWPVSSVFASLEEASAFFAAGSLGYSATADQGRFDGLELRCRAWRVEPLEVDEVRSRCFEDATLFPRGSIAFDCALLMRGVAHEWHAQEPLCCPVVRVEPVSDSR